MVTEDDGPRGRSAPFPTPALGGHEAENRYSEGARARPAGAADGRAVRQARRPDPKQAARGTERVVLRTHVTVVFVTRSLQEALILGDRVVVLGRAPAGSRRWWRSRA